MKTKDNEVINSESEFSEKDVPNFIEIKKINKTYPDGYVAVKNINFEIKKGEFVTILGPSGCGKTTILKMIGGFELPTSGKILVNKIDIKDLPIQRRPTATVFQDYALFPNMNVEKNIAYGLTEIRKPIENVSADYQKESEKYFNDCLKKSKSKIKDIERKRDGFLKDIQKLENKINNSKILSEVNTMTEEEYEEKIETLEKEYFEKNKKELHKSIPVKVKFIEFINNTLSFFRINKNIDFKANETDELVQTYLKYEKAYRVNLITKQEIDYLNHKAADLDYWVSYWQNYPYQEKEWFDKKKLTRKLTKQEIKEEVQQIIKIIGLEGKEKKWPSDLSGGMQQRVALARALVIKPETLLLDEPLSALDAKVRAQMQQELKNLHKKFGITFILVTHDQEEALTLSDKIIVMSQGKIQQIGTPNEIYDLPANNWVANFIGKANILNATYLKGNKIKLFDNVLNADSRYKDKFKENEEVNVMIRPEDFDVVGKDKGKIKVTVLETTYKGLMWELICEFEGVLLTLEAVNKVNLEQEIYLTWDDEDMHIMKKDDENDTYTDESSEFLALTKNAFKKKIKEIKSKKNKNKVNGKKGDKNDN
ncbi:ATP-binding cassette domain-containing protein [Malacoplasma penetrans]|uniref:Spermidine/putrescine import ATP-binding protein PotA n=1 Tax=Malacoplasma penetrans (strain HF-2) TaxID=272633 RepID=POTA_MALP2|nr:ATP-binding cassette domain-containing protein [Malacoplasma penetrans]Q8EUR3.1 RecName: Full=Spermidine/putrescine import ATP-binding protein PotA [Malacoplasma penetrans HF-2]RXY97062.1 ATP-binding cassette domain-containing protein [Malacoplasma penetrans]BAC44649.1 spermidine/putrescine transport ATP-binding protein PotA [Malacoplasma penetrans HF-2]